VDAGLVVFTGVDMDLFDKDEGYYAQSRDDVMSLIPPEARTILDVGCGKGILGRKLSTRERKVCGIEKDPVVAEEASRHLETVVVGDVESVSLPFTERSFDCLIFADILEHLKDPWEVLRSMRRFLSEGGEVVASIPNVRHYKVIRSLVRGHWNYTRSGILDITHLRFFTLEGIRSLFEQTGYRRSG
jgi:2-polyprenyl-3-methyl-5-hydroxy-6-metoxy-1,4-benzoquinol methylase